MKRIKTESFIGFLFRDDKPYHHWILALFYINILYIMPLSNFTEYIYLQGFIISIGIIYFIIVDKRAK
jgi:hypothetical protein